MAFLWRNFDYGVDVCDRCTGSYLLMPLNREIICIYWLKFLLGVLFWAAGIGIFDMAKNAEEKREKILLYFSCFSVLAFGIWYALYLILADFIGLF